MKLREPDHKYANVTRYLCFTQDGNLQHEAEHLKEHVQEFTSQVLEMAESPYGSSSSSSSHNNERGPGRGPSSSSSSSLSFGGPGGSFGGAHHHAGRMERFRGAYVEEPLIPALFYVTLAAMTGSIIARKSKCR